MQVSKSEASLSLTMSRIQHVDANYDSKDPLCCSERDTTDGMFVELTPCSRQREAGLQSPVVIQS